MNISLVQANNLLNYYEETVIKLRQEVENLKIEGNKDWTMSLDMYMYCLRYTFKLADAYKISPIQFYKDEVLEMMHRFEKHAANNKDSRLFNLNISIIEYCVNAYKEMEKIPTKS
jgi:hypothetical protein